MNKDLSLFIIVLLLGACGGTGGSEKAGSSTEIENSAYLSKEAYFDHISKIDLCLGATESFDDLKKRSYDEMIKPLKSISDLGNLKTLFYALNERYVAEPPRDPENVRCGSMNYIGRDRVVDRIGEIGDEGAAKLLMEFYEDSAINFYGGSLYTLRNNMVKCGDYILPLIEPVQDKRVKIGSHVVSELKKKN